LILNLRRSLGFGPGLVLRRGLPNLRRSLLNGGKKKQQCGEKKKFKSHL
jgi:hypothetical protein